MDSRVITVGADNRKHQKQLDSFAETLRNICSQRVKIDDLLDDSIRHGAYTFLKEGTYYWIFGAMRQPELLNLPHCAKGEILGLSLPSLDTVTARSKEWTGTFVGGLPWKDSQILRGTSEATLMFRLTSARLNCFQVRSTGRSILVAPSSPVEVVWGVAPAERRERAWKLITSQDAPISAVA